MNRQERIDAVVSYCQGKGFRASAEMMLPDDVAITFTFGKYSSSHHDYCVSCSILLTTIDSVLDAWLYQMADYHMRVINEAIAKDTTT